MSAEGLPPEGRAQAIGPDSTTGMDIMPPPAGASSSTRLRVDIHDIQAYERNPRREPNPLYYELRQSIRDRGLDQVLPITRRPSEAHYIIGAGGNTRLEILHELYAETGAERFRYVDCRYRAWQSEPEVLIAHLTENDLRAPLAFIERAHAVLDLEGLIAAETGRRLSQAELSECLASRYGYRVSQTLISHMHYAIEVLEPVLPHALRGGLGKRQVERLRALERTIARFLEARGRAQQTEAVWQWFLQCLAQYDCLDCRDFTPAEEDLAQHLVALTQEPIAWVSLDLDELLKGASEVRPYAMSPETEAQLDVPASSVVPMKQRARRPARPSASAGSNEAGSAETRLASEAACFAPGEEASQPPSTGAPADEAKPLGAQLVALPSARPGEPAGAPSALRQQILAHAQRLAGPSALSEAIVAAHHGVGFFMDLPPTPLVEGGAPGAEGRAGRKRAALWWLLASLSEQFLHGTEVLVQALETTRLMALATASGDTGHEDVSYRLHEYVGEPALEALGRDLLAELTEAERRDLAALLAARCELQAACTRLAQASPWEV